MRTLPTPRAVNGYWTIQPRIDGRRTTRTFGSIAGTSLEQAKAAVRDWYNSRQTPSTSGPISVRSLAESYLEYARDFYVRADGEPTGEAANQAYALKPFVELFGRMPAGEIRPRHFEAFTMAQVKAKVSRQTINKRIGILKRWLKWGAKSELIPTETHAICSLVESVKAGKMNTREAPRIGAVTMATVNQTCEALPPTLVDMVRLQIAAAMRPEEVCAMRLCDITTTGDEWLYVPAWHKNSHRGQERRIWLGPVCQEIIGRHMGGKALSAPLFSPREAVAERRGKAPAQRIGACYDTRSYRKAIWYACDRAFPAPDGLDAEALKKWRRANRWSPNRLRKLGLDIITRTFDAHAAKAAAGHTRVETTREHYLSQNDAIAREVARKVG